MTDAKLSDEEVICGWMEPVVGFRGVDYPKSVKGWWVAELGKPKTPCDLTLDALHEVEARLTDEQWDRYGSEFDYPATARNRKPLLHATAADKIKALATVLREAPGGDHGTRAQGRLL